MNTVASYYDYCPYCHSEHRIQWVRTRLIYCLDCHYEETPLSSPVTPTTPAETIP